MILSELIVVNNEKDIAELVCDIAEQTGFGVDQYDNSEVFKQKYNECVDVILIDLIIQMWTV